MSIQWYTIIPFLYKIGGNEMEDVMKLYKLEQSLEHVVDETFSRFGYRDGLDSIKNDLLCLLGDELLPEEKHKFVLVSTAELYEGSGTLFEMAIHNMAMDHFRRKGEWDNLRECDYNRFVEYIELMETIELVRTQLH